MIGIVIICSFDAVKKTAERLTRLLEAEEHPVRLMFGRFSVTEIEAVKASNQAVLLIWSADAATQTYMRDWARQSDPDRLIEIALEPGWPDIKRKAPVIDFSSWRGERGGRAWSALNDRLRAVGRIIDPPKPPSRNAVLALSAASIAALVGAAAVRANMDGAQSVAEVENAETTEVALAAPDPETGVGGVLSIVEPASEGDLGVVARIPNTRFVPLELTSPPDLMPIEPWSPPEIRRPTLFERISALNPLRNDGDEEPPSPQE